MQWCLSPSDSRSSVLPALRIVLSYVHFELFEVAGRFGKNRAAVAIIVD